MFFVISFKISERKKTEKLANMVCPNISCKMISSWHKNQQKCKQIDLKTDRHTIIKTHCIRDNDDVFV